MFVRYADNDHLVESDRGCPKPGDAQHVKGTKDEHGDDGDEAHDGKGEHESDEHEWREPQACH